MGKHLFPQLPDKRLCEELFHELLVVVLEDSVVELEAILANEGQDILVGVLFGGLGEGVVYEERDHS